MPRSLPRARFFSVLLALGSAANAQTADPGALAPAGGSTPAAAASSSGMLAALDVDGGASPGQGPPAWTIEPRIMLSETLTDNVRVNGSASRQADQITEIAPGIRIQAKSARLKGYFDYTLRQQVYAQHPDYGRTQNALNTMSTLEAVEKWLFVDFTGLVTQQAISAFGAQSPSNTSINSNVIESSTYRVSPRIIGQIAEVAEYSLRYDASTTRSSSATTSNIDVSQWSGQLRGGTPFQRLKWTIDGSQVSNEYSGTRYRDGLKNDSDRFSVTGSYLLFPDFSVSLSSGRETNNYASPDQQSRETHGYGFEWNPTERTRITASRERRFFGNGHSFSFSHRFPLSSISYTDTKDVSLLPNQFSQAGQSADWQRAENLCMSEGRKEDPQCINDWLALWQGSSDFLSARLRLQRRQQLALALMGARNSLTLLADRSESQSLLASEVLDETTQSSLIRQKGLSLNLTHRLSPTSNLSVIASRRESIGSGNGDVQATTTIYQLGLTTKLGSRTRGSLNARHSSFDNHATPYKENAVIGSIYLIY